jgi:hypothetical protein
MINKVCFSFVGSTDNEYSSCVKPLGVKNMTNTTPAVAATIPPIIGILFAIKKQHKTRIIDFSYSSLIIEPRILLCQLKSIFFTVASFFFVKTSITFER